MLEATLNLAPTLFAKLQTPSPKAIGQVDTEMSDTSENAVQNKVIKGYVDNAVAGSVTFTVITTSESGISVES